MPKAWKATVTFERPESAPPETIRLTVEGGSGATAASRAVRVALKQRQMRVWKSLLVLIERGEVS